MHHLKPSETSAIKYVNQISSFQSYSGHLEPLDGLDLALYDSVPTIDVRNMAKSLSKGYTSLQILQRYFTAKLNHLSATLCRYFVGQY
jgi:hypothetical protein